MGQCLRGKMTDAGLIPATAMVEPGAPAEEVAVVVPEPTTPPAQPDTDIAEPALDVTPPAAITEVPENLIAATFGLLRAEPDGSVVIAGSGTPGSEVEVYSNGSLLGKTTVETSGDWVLVPDAPLPVGGVEITLGEAGKTGRAAESFVVAISEDKTSQPLVVASTPGAASEILQGLEPPAMGTTTEVATADPVTPAEPTGTPEPVAPSTTSDIPGEPAAEAPATAATSVVPATGEQPVADPAAAPVAETAAAAAEPAEPAQAAIPDADSSAPVAEPAVPSAAVAMPAVDAPAASEMAVAETEPSAGLPAGTFSGTPPTIDAIESEGDRTFFAGGGPDGATIRLYVDDLFIADTKVEDGRWLVEAGKVLSQPSQRIRIDMLEADSANVAARAEVDFIIDLPADAAPAAVAQAEPETSTAAPAPGMAPSDASTDVASSPPPADQPVQPTAPADAPIAVAETDATAEPSATAIGAPATPGETEIDPALATAETAIQPTLETGVPTMVAMSIGDPDAARFVAGKAIIRRGDNLWTIARRTYGDGVKYTTIYQANTGQIRDPDRIYPGQVFDLPAEAN